MLKGQVVAFYIVILIQYLLPLLSLMMFWISVWAIYASTLLQRIQLSTTLYSPFLKHMQSGWVVTPILLR